MRTIGCARVDHLFPSIEASMNTSTRRLLLALVWLLLVADRAAMEPALDPIRYRLSFPAPQTHYVEVEATIPTARQPAVELMMPVWTPGSYLVRDHSRHIDAVHASGANGAALRVTKTDKNHWRIETTGLPAITVTYRVYCRELTERTNWVDNEFAMLNGAATYLTLTEPRAKRPHEVHLVLPAAWTAMSSLPAATDGQAHHYRAEDFDALVDAPILAGRLAIDEFEVGGKTHAIVHQGDIEFWDRARYARDTEKIVRETVRFWGSVPYDRYLFFNVVGDAGGGLEHANSVMLLSNRWQMVDPAAYQNMLKLTAHEFFHAWNVKRLRPIELGPFDYDREVYTPSLWIAEGVTEYYARLHIRRTGLSDDAEWLQDISALIRRVQTTPGRLVQPIAGASFDAWLRHFRPYENSNNVTVNFYTKGALIGFLLDAKIRKATNGAKSLDDAMRLAMARFGGARGYTPQEFQATVREVAGVDLGGWWQSAVDSTAELDYTEALDWYGLRFKPAAESHRATLGLSTRNDNGRLVVSQVRRGTPGYDAGFNVDDEILAIGDLQMRPESWPKAMDWFKSGQTVSVLVARRSHLIRLESTLGRETANTWQLEVSPEATADQRAHFAAVTTPHGSTPPVSMP
jgi:predicted metalloprotease with PDZ domain